MSPLLVNNPSRKNLPLCQKTLLAQPAQLLEAYQGIVDRFLLESLLVQF
jgi:hypothetical protein